MHGSLVLRPGFFLLGLSLTTPALAQRAANNAITASDDAFGSAIGNERIGIYSQDDVRGFNPIDSGNARIDGLYFDEVVVPTSRLTERNSIRVGYAALPWSFPAPTGIVNRQLDKFEGENSLGLEAETDADGNNGTTGEARVGLIGEELGLHVSAGSRHSRIPATRYLDFIGGAANLTWRPNKKSEANLFWSLYRTSNLNGTVLLFPSGGAPPPRIERRRFLGQDWAHGAANNYTFGGTGRTAIGPLNLDIGIFRSIRDERDNFADIALGVDRNGRAAREVIVAEQAGYAGSTSGEARLAGTLKTGSLSHRLTATLRARDQTRRFGGQVRVDLGSTSLFDRVAVPQPALPYGPKDEQRVRQITFGFAWDVATRGGIRLGAAVQHTRYSRRVAFGRPGLVPANSQDRPFLISANVLVPLAKSISLYGAFVQGLEDSPNAPNDASNPGEPPPASRTEQREVGARFALSRRVTLIAGAFEVKKPYYNLDSDRRYGVLGQISNRGAEVSLTGSPIKGLTLVAGGLLLDPQIAGPLVNAGTIGRRPVGIVRRRAILNLDWRLKGGTSPWSFDLAADHSSGAAANTANSFEGPGRETINLGARYRFDLAGAKWLVRAQVTNALNDYGWRVTGSGGFLFTQPRTYVATLSADF